MDIANYTKLFGLPSTDSAVEAMFLDLGIKRRPALSDPPRSPYDAILKVSSLGILLCFTERNYWENLPPRMHGKGRELVFRNIAITSGIPEQMRPYEGPMPLGLDWADSRKSARSKMAALGHGTKLRAYKRDAWRLSDYHLRVTYMPGDINQAEQPGLFDISMGILLPASAPPVRALSYPTPEEIQTLFGQSCKSPQFQHVFRDFEPDDLAESVEKEAIDRKHEYGFELYFDPRRPAPDGSPGFVGIDMTRDRLGDSRPWRGKLPFALDFNDTPAALAEKVGQRPNQWEESHTWGVGRWYLPTMLLWINFDNLDNRLESVSILAPGYRDDLRG